MKVGLISDTHDNMGMIERSLGLFGKEGIDAIVHAGDWVAPFAARRFEAFSGKIFGSFGNNDGEVIGLTRAFREMGAWVKGEFTEFELEGERMAVVHGTYPPVVEALVSSQLFPTIIFGHSHKPLVQHRGDVLLINPGEACGYLYGRSTVAIMDTKEHDAKIFDL